jgi:hypothetical protein
MKRVLQEAPRQTGKWLRADVPIPRRWNMQSR